MSRPIVPSVGVGQTGLDVTFHLTFDQAAALAARLDDLLGTLPPAGVGMQLRAHTTDPDVLAELLPELVAIGMVSDDELARLALRCPGCQSVSGEWCRTRHGDAADRLHQVRTEASWRRMAADCPVCPARSGHCCVDRRGDVRWHLHDERVAQD